MKPGTTYTGSAICTRNDCFANEFGRCAVLIDDGKDFAIDCKFFKAPKQFNADAERAAQRAEAYKARKQNDTADMLNRG